MEKKKKTKPQADSKRFSESEDFLTYPPQEKRDDAGNKN